MSLVSLLVIQLASALIQPGHGSWYDLNRPTYYDPSSGLPYEWSNNNGHWVLIPRPVGQTYNPLFLDNVNGYYRRAPNADQLSQYRMVAINSKGESARSRLAYGPKSLKYYVMMRGGS